MANIKWNKKICIQHIVEMRSPFENQQAGANANKPRLPQMAAKLRQMQGQKKV